MFPIRVGRKRRTPDIFVYRSLGSTRTVRAHEILKWGTGAVDISESILQPVILMRFKFDLTIKVTQSKFSCVLVLYATANKMLTFVPNF